MDAAARRLAAPPTTCQTRGLPQTAGWPQSPSAPPPTVAARITVSLMPKAASDLQKTHDRTLMSKTDIINRVLSLYEFVEGELTGGAELVIRRDGQDHLVKFL